MFILASSLDSISWLTLKPDLNLVLSCVLGGEEDQSKQDYYDDQIQLLEIIQLIWSLCEILFIDISPGKPYVVFITPRVAWDKHEYVLIVLL